MTADGVGCDAKGMERAGQETVDQDDGDAGLLELMSGEALGEVRIICRLELRVQLFA